MTRHDPEDLDSATEEWVRGLLADTRGEQLPAEVRTRLDDVLAGLRTEAPATVVPLHRRWAPRLLAAAAAVLVIGGGGYVADQVVQGSGGEADTTAGAAARATQDGAPATERAPLSPTGGASPSRGAADSLSAPAATVPDQVRALTRELAQAPVVSVDDTRGDVFVLAAQVAQGQRLAYYAEHAAPALNGTSPLSDKVTQGLFGDTFSTKVEAGEAPQVQDAGGSGCAGPSVTDSVSLRVRYDGGLAVVVLHVPVDAPPDSTTLSAELWTCDGSKALVSLPVS